MALRNQRLRRRLLRILPVLAALVALLTSLVLVSDVQQEPSAYNRIYLWVLVLTVLALALLFIAIVSRVASLVRKIRAEEPGARLSARWARNFLALSLPPVLIVYFFAALFLTRIVDNWFDVQVDTALADSLRLGQQFLDQRTLEVRNQMQRLSAELDAREDVESIRDALLANVGRSGPVELSVFDAEGRVVATANYSALADLPRRPDDYALLQTRERGEYAAAEPTGDGGLQIRVLQLLDDALPGGEPSVLQAFYPLPEAITTLTASIEQEYYRYQTVSLLRKSLKYSFVLILSLVLLLTVLLAILAALAAARRMVTPLSRLAEATERVAGGDLQHAVESQGRDEVAFLSHSFNDMTRALLAASDEAERSRERLAAQGEYLETVLGSLSTGVLTLDAEGRIQRLNRAGERILSLEPDAIAGATLAGLAREEPELAPLVEAVTAARNRGRSGWQREVPLERNHAPLVLLARGSRLTGADGDGGQVVVFDDVTVLNRAQREAAWAEVARRLAHEVKNPLTPIRLAAERLRMKLMDRLEERDADMLDKSASTIVAQVEALRRLVDAFGDYAREPEHKRQAVALDELVREVVELYRQGDPRLRIDLDLCPGPPGLSADAGQLRQLLHNLLRNAIEAAKPGAAANLRVHTRVRQRDDWPRLELEVSDDGPGFPADVLAQPFEPYVTHKPGGSGLGLAICRKIVLDHDGDIEIGNPETGGARAVVTLPLRLQNAGHGDSATAAEAGS